LRSGGRHLRPRLARALELANLTPAMHVLDIGCGRGEITLHAARLGATVIAVDFSPDCLQLTSATLQLGPPAARTQVHLVQADAGALPVADGSVHRLFCLDVAEHLQPWQLRQMLAEIKRVLRPDGYAVIHTLPNRWALEIGYPLLRWLWPGLPAGPRSAYEERVHVNELDPVRLFRVLSEAGLQSRVWVENWTPVHARWGTNRRFADPLREASYPLLRQWWVGPITQVLMRTPLGWILGNDLFAIAWPPGCPAPARVWARG
jgi:SAM-dependent methyltransferase